MDIETVDEHCKHTDCVYRTRLDVYGRHFCAYALAERRSRGCSISECDKYRAGKKRPAIKAGTMQLEWEIDDGRSDTGNE